MARLTMPKLRARPTIVQTRRLDRMSTVDFHASLCHTDWSPVFSRVGLTDQWSAFTQLLLPILDFHAPFQRLKIHNPSAPPASDTTLRLMAQRRGLLAREGRTPAFLTLDKRVKAAIKRDVRDDIASRVRRQGPTSTFRNLRQVIEGGKSTQRAAPEATPTELNENFVGVGPRVAAEVPRQGGAPSPTLSPAQSGCLCLFLAAYLPSVSSLSPFFHEKFLHLWL